VRAKIDERGRGDAADHHEQSEGLVRQQFLRWRRLTAVLLK
jgi:hypothetical protein